MDLGLTGAAGAWQKMSFRGMLSILRQVLQFFPALDISFFSLPSLIHCCLTFLLLYVRNPGEYIHLYLLSHSGMMHGASSVPAVGRPSVYIERKVILQMNCSVLCISQVAYLYRHRTRLYHGSLWVFQHPQMDEWKLCLGLVRQKLEMPALECEIAGDWGRWNL